MSQSHTEYDLFIDGEFTASESDERVEVSYPYDGTVWATVPAGTRGDVDDAVAAASAAFESAEWGALLPGQRASIIEDIADALDDHAEELAALETRQNGKLIREMRGQMGSLGEWFRYFAARCRTAEGRTIPVTNKDGQFHTYVKKEPYGGEQPDGLPGECFFEPTVLTDVDNEMTVAREEIFGPVASVLTFEDEDEVLDLANDSDFGLAAGVWTEDMRQAYRFAERIDAGTVWVDRAGEVEDPFRLG